MEDVILHIVFSSSVLAVAAWSLPPLQNSDNEWPILLAAQNGHTDVIRMLHKVSVCLGKSMRSTTVTDAAGENAE